MVTLLLRQGIDSGYAWPIVDAAGQPADLTGWTVLAHVRDAENPGGVLLHEFTTGVIHDTSTITISWTAEESLTWQWGTGYFDVVLVDADDRPRQIVAQGVALVDRVVSHA